MWKYFPELTEERIGYYTKLGYVFIFRYVRAIEMECPKDLVKRQEYETSTRLQSGHDPITKVVPFDQGYAFLKTDDENRYLLRELFAGELENWARFYNCCDETDEEMRRWYLSDCTLY